MDKIYLQTCLFRGNCQQRSKWLIHREIRISISEYAPVSPFYDYNYGFEDDGRAQGREEDDGGILLDDEDDQDILPLVSRDNLYLPFYNTDDDEGYGGGNASKGGGAPQPRTVGDDDREAGNFLDREVKTNVEFGTVTGRDPKFLAFATLELCHSFLLFLHDKMYKALSHCMCKY